MARLSGVSSRPSDASSTAFHSPGSTDRSTASLALAQCEVFQTTFSLHRASPLFVGAEPLSESRLQLLSQRLRDLLVGDVVRGVEVGLDSAGGSMGSAGGLEAVVVEWVATDDVLGLLDDEPAQGLQVTLQYEKALCTALLLPAPGPQTAQHPFLPLPLLLLRMPTPLKTVIVTFLASTFDCRIGPLRLSSDDLVERWEAWARSTALPSASSALTRKDVVLTLGICLPGNVPGSEPSAAETDKPDTSSAASGLKSIDVIVPAQDLPRFLRAGALGPASDKGTANKPFTKALAQYLKHHLALNMESPAVRVVRIACGGFVLAESRLKVFGAPDAGSDGSHLAAVQQLMGALAARAAGAGPRTDAEGG